MAGKSLQARKTDASIEHLYKVLRENEVRPDAPKQYDAETLAALGLPSDYLLRRQKGDGD